MKFIHCADLHIDSPLRKLSTYADTPAEEIKTATRSAFEKIVQHCLAEEVDFLLIAGDLFDGNCRDFNTILWICAQVRRLGNIPVLIVHGNHDYSNGLAKQIPWPKNTHLFPWDKPSTVQITCKDGLKVAIHGQSYSKPAVRENLALNFPEAITGAINIGLLHCNFEGSANHDPYAPCKRSDLVCKFYDYWALGHIHKTVCYEPSKAGDPWIVYPGNIQGRHIGETGAKGCFLVLTNQNGFIQPPQFLSTDTLRWQELWLELQIKHRSYDDLAQLLEDQLDQLRKSKSTQANALRIYLSGESPLYEELLTDWTSTELRIRDLCSTYQNIWIEKVYNKTKPCKDLAAIKNNPFMAKIVDDFEQLLLSGEHIAILNPLAKEVEQATGDLVHKSQWDQQQNLELIVDKSKAYLLSKLVDGGFFED